MRRASDGCDDTDRCRHFTTRGDARRRERERDVGAHGAHARWAINRAYYERERDRERDGDDERRD